MSVNDIDSSESGLEKAALHEELGAAEAAGLSSKMISKYESGERVPPSYKKLVRFASAMGFGPEKVDCTFLGLEVVCDIEEPRSATLSRWASQAGHLTARKAPSARSLDPAGAAW